MENANTLNMSICVFLNITSRQEKAGKIMLGERESYPKLLPVGLNKNHPKLLALE